MAWKTDHSKEYRFSKIRNGQSGRQSPLMTLSKSPPVIEAIAHASAILYVLLQGGYIHYAHSDL